MKFPLTPSLLAIVLPGLLSAADWFVGPEGREANAGTKESPWDIASALGGGQKIAPGDTLWILPGEYRPPWKPGDAGQGFALRLRGDPGRPITVRSAPGARVVLGGLQVVAPATHLVVRDLEIAGRTPVAERRSAQRGSHPTDLPAPLGGLSIHAGEGCRYVNLYIHDNLGSGVNFWSTARDSEMHGCVIVNNGWDGPDRAHGHAIYTQNETGWKTFSANILSAREGGGRQTMQAYGSAKAYVNNFLFIDNIAYAQGRFLVGGGRPSRNIRLLRNHFLGVPLQVGYTAPENEEVELRTNTVFRSSLSIQRFKQVVQENNRIIGPADDLNNSPPRVVWIPNDYDPERAHLVVYNGAKSPVVRVPAPPFFPSGRTARFMDPLDLHGAPSFQGTLEAEGVDLPVPGEYAVLVVFLLP